MSSFTHILSEDLIFSLIDHVCDMVAGVEKIICIYGHPETGELCGITMQYTNHRLQEHQMNLAGLSEPLTALRNTNNKHRWLQKSQLPFDTADSSQKQLNIFDESKHLILLITLPGSKRLEKNILIIYFKDQFNTFGVQHQNSSLSTENKTIIAHLLSGSIHSFCKLYWKENEHLQLFANKTRRIFEHQRLDNLKDTRKRELEDFICSWANTFLAECSDSDGVNYVYSVSALEKIKKYAGDFKQLEKALQEAVSYTKTIVTNVTKEIQAEYIELFTCENSVNILQESQNSPRNLTERQQRVFDYMNRLEAAAIEADRNAQKLTGRNIGLSMKPQSVSAPALSDFISKNKETINSLFLKYPDNWNFVKNNFRTVINITVNENRQARKWA